MCLPADSDAEGTTCCCPLQTTHQVDTVGRGEGRQEEHGQAGEQGEERVSWRMSHLNTQPQKDTNSERNVHEEVINNMLVYLKRCSVKDLVTRGEVACCITSPLSRCRRTYGMGNCKSMAAPYCGAAPHVMLMG